MTGSKSDSEAARDGDGRISVAIHLQAAPLSGGDFCAIQALDGDHRLLLVGDVSGIGPEAARLARRFEAAWQSALARHPRALDLALEATEAKLQADNPESLFVTVLAVEVDLRTGALACCNAGHETAYALRPGRLRRLQQRGRPPLCAVDAWPVVVERDRLEPGELLCVLTDGIPEATDPAGQLFGRERLEASLMRSGALDPEAVIRTLSEDVARFTRAATPSDDRSVAVLRWNGPGRRLQAPERWHARFAARPEVLPGLRGFIEEACGALGADGPATLRIALVAEELFLNSVLHGYGGQSGEVRLTLDLRDEELRLVAEDEAPAFDPFAALPEPDTATPRVGGLGRVLVAGLATRHRYQRLAGCNRVTVHMLRRAS